MFYTEETNGITLYKSSLLNDEKLVHCFTTRTGGNTPKPLESFSMGWAHNPELKDYVEDNRKKICKILGMEHKNLVIPEQKHTDNIKIITSPDDDVSECDGLITQNPELLLMLLFADCVPVIIYAPDKHVLSVIHAGWKGTAKSIVKKAVGLMEEKFGADVKNIQAVIGPAIGKCCYPVSTEVADELKSTINANKENIFTTNIENDKLIYIDLKKLNGVQLGECGVTYIDKSDNCTKCMNSVFYSYRAEEGKTGRHAAIASLKSL